MLGPVLALAVLIEKNKVEEPGLPVDENSSHC